MGIRIRTILIILTMIIFVSACGKDKAQESVQPEENSVIYHVDKTLLSTINQNNPEFDIFAITEEAVYFGKQIPTKVEGYDHGTELMYVERKNPEIIHSIRAFEQARVLGIHVTKGVDGQEIILVSGVDEDQTFFLELSKNGEELSSWTVSDAKIYPYLLYKFPDGRMIAADSMYLYIVQTDGTYAEPIACPGISYQSIESNTSGQVYVTYLEEESIANEIGSFSIAEVNVNYNRLMDGVKLPGDGRNIAFSADDKVLSFTAKEIYAADVKSGSTECLIELKKYPTVVVNQVKTMCTDGTEFAFVCWDIVNTGKPIEIDQFVLGEATSVPEQEDPELYDEAGRRIIKLYGSSEQLVNLSIGELMISRFNSENEKYCVQVESYKDVNLMFVSDKSPDLVYVMSPADVEMYYRNGYLADLLPLAAETGAFTADDLEPFQFVCFGFKGGLYAISETCSLQTIYAPKSQMNGRNSWTVQEYLDYLENNPTICGTSYYSEKRALEEILIGNMDSYVDFATGDCYFNEPDFMKMVERLHSIDFSHVKRRDFGTDEIFKPDTIPYLFNEWSSSVTPMAEYQVKLQDELVCVGLPNDGKGTGAVLYPSKNLCIPAKSTCKEGAMEFLRYMLEYQKSIWAFEDTLETEEEDTMRSAISLRGTKSAFEEDKKRGLGMHKRVLWTNSNETPNVLEYEITEKEVALLTDAWYAGQADTYVKQELRKIITEELEPYFQGDKRLTDVCQIIQNRAEILVNE